MTQYKCYKCEYEWEVRTPKPKSCPRCKTRLDIVIKEKVPHPPEQEVYVDEKQEAKADLAKDNPDTKMER